MTQLLSVRSVIRTTGLGLAMALFGIVVWARDEPTRKPESTTATETATTKVAVSRVPTLEEARDRARLLHETIHDTLQLVHGEYYREDEGLTLPAATLNRVFSELAERRKVKLRWLVVEGRAMNVDHNPRDDFEKQAALAIGSGKPEFEVTKDGVYRYAAAITLGSECLKCHLPNRTSNKSRAAGLTISMPVETK